MFYQRKKNYNKAEFLYRKLYNINQYDVDIAGNLAFVLAKQGDFQEPTNILFKNMELVGLNELNMSFLAKIYFLNKQYKAARKWLYLSFKYINFIQSNYSIENFILYSRTLREEGRLKDAVFFLEKNLSIGCQSANYLAHLGAYSVMLGKTEQGLEFLNLAIQKKKYPLWVNNWINKAKNL